MLKFPNHTTQTDYLCGRNGLPVNASNLTAFPANGAVSLSPGFMGCRQIDGRRMPWRNCWVGSSSISIAKSSSHEGRSISRDLSPDRRGKVSRDRNRASEETLLARWSSGGDRAGWRHFYSTCQPRPTPAGTRAETIYLDADFDLLHARCCQEEGTRPLMQDPETVSRPLRRATSDLSSWRTLQFKSRAARLEMIAAEIAKHGSRTRKAGRIRLGSW